MRSVESFAAWAALSSLLILPGCRTQSSTVAVLPRTTATILWEPLHAGVLEAARDTGSHIYWNAPTDEGDSERQVSFIAAAIRRKDSGIILAPDETLASRSIVLQAMARGIPVVIVDDELGPPASQLLSYVSNDEAIGARLAAERVAKVLAGHGSIAVLGITARMESGLTREENFEAVLRKIAPDIHITVRRFGDTVITHQQQIAQEILNGKDQVDAMITMTATATRGAYYAKIATEPQPAVVVIGFDQDILAPIQSGEVDSVVVQDTRTIGEVSMRHLQAQMAGGPVPEHTLVPPLLVSRDTIQSDAAMRIWLSKDASWSRQ